MAGTIIADVIQSDQSYPSSINIASPMVVANTINMSNGSLTGNVNFDSGTLFVDSVGNGVGLNHTQPNQFTANGRVLSVCGGGDNSTPSVIRMAGRGTIPGRGFVETEVFGLAGIANTATEITRITGTNTNGFRMLMQIVVCGHTGSVGNAHHVGWYHWDGGTESVVTISEDVEPTTPVTISFDTSTSHVCIVKLAGRTGGNFNGVMEVKYYVPIDFASSNYTTS